MCSSAERWTRRKRKQQNPFQTLKGVGKHVGLQILDQNIYLFSNAYFAELRGEHHWVFCCHNRMIEDIYALTLMDLVLRFGPSFAPGQTTKLRLPSDVTSQVTAWKWTLGCLQRQVELVILGFLCIFKYWNDMTWVSYVHHMCLFIVIWLVCRIQRALPLKSNALALSKWAACPAKVISSQRWHRRVASDCSWQFRGTSNSNCYWLASSKISTFSIYLTINT